MAESILLLADDDLWLALELVRLLALEPIIMKIHYHGSKQVYKSALCAKIIIYMIVNCNTLHKWGFVQRKVQRDDTCVVHFFTRYSIRHGSVS